MNCLDEGRLQALLDGELPAEARREAEAHLALCPTCATAMAVAAREFALFSQALAVEEPLTVPTERLRANIASAVAEMRAAQATDGVAARGSSGGRRSFWSSLAASFAPRQVAVFAGLALAAVVLAATFFALRPGRQPGNEGPREIAKGSGPQPRPSMDASVAQPTASPAAVEPGADDGGEAAEEVAKFKPKGAGSELAKSLPKPGPSQPGKTSPKTPRPIDRAPGLFEAKQRPRTPRPDLLPVEREYAREIAALKTSIERQKLQTLSPTLRAEYERNVAVVDEAIASTRQAVKSNPRDKDAQEFLRAAYQDKVDLLSAVAGKSELAAAGRD